MAGLRIRWRRESAERQPTPAAIRDWASSGIRLGVFVWVAAVAILVLAGAVRLYNVSWDESTHLHPDERHLTTVANDVRLPASVSGYFDSAHPKLNPYNRPGGGSFVYGPLPLFRTKASAAALDFDNYDQIVLVGRHLSAIFDLATVAVVFLI